MGIFRGFSRLLDALNGVAASIRDLTNAQREVGPATHRLEALERHRALFEAEMQGLLLQADGKMKAAKNAEARERQMKASYERNADPFPEAGDEPTSDGGIPPVHVEASEGERLPTLHLAVAPDHKNAAIKAKWSR